MEGGLNVALGAERQAPMLLVVHFSQWNLTCLPSHVKHGLGICYRSWALELAFAGRQLEWSLVSCGEWKSRGQSSALISTADSLLGQEAGVICFLRNKSASNTGLPVGARFYVCNGLSAAVVLAFLSFWKSPTSAAAPLPKSQLAEQGSQPGTAAGAYVLVSPYTRT